MILIMFLRVFGFLIFLQALNYSFLSHVFQSIQKSIEKGRYSKMKC